MIVKTFDILILDYLNK